MAIFESSAKGLIRVIDGKWPNLEWNSKGQKYSQCNSYYDLNYRLEQNNDEKDQKRDHIQERENFRWALVQNLKFRKTFSNSIPHFY